MLTDKEKRALTILDHHHSFNTLSKADVEEIGKMYDIDAFELCKTHGITYTI